MLYIYLISIELSYLSLVLFLIRLFINRNNLNISRNKDKWKIFMTLLVVCAIPIVNIFFAISSAYISILMKNEKFIKFINQ